MKRAFSIALLLIVALASAPTPAQQRPGGSRGPQPAAPSRQAPPAPPRDPGSQNRQAPQPGRMSDQERQQLRRDISDHGRDIYRERSAPKRP